MNFVKHQVIEFKRKNHLRKVTLKNLLEICHKKGYIVKYYSTSKLIFATLNIWTKAKNADSISIVDSNGNTIIFLRDTFSGEKKLYALAHELGHITLKHEDHSEDYAEREADLFAHYLLSGTTTSKPTITISIICMIISVCFVIIDVVSVPSSNKISTSALAEIESYQEIDAENTEDTICYFTKYGQVYHLYPDCQYVQNAKYVYTDTIEHSHRERLCSACERRLNN